MIIEALDLLAYGRFTEHSLDLSAGPSRFHIVCGPNESGKSTCLRAISALFFGIPGKTTDNFLHENRKLRVGATLFDEQSGRLSLIRRKGNKDTLLGMDGKSKLPSDSLDAMLGGIDESTFHQRFGLSYEQLVAGGKAIVDSGGDLGQILFAAGAGVGQLKAVQSELSDETADLFKARGSKSQIQLLLKQVEQKRKELRDLQTLPSHYRKLNEELNKSLDARDGLEAELLEMSRILQRQKNDLQAIPILPEWNRARGELAKLTDVPILDADFPRRRRDAGAKRETARRLIESRQREMEGLQGQIDALHVEQLLLDHSGQIESLFQNVAARRDAEKTLEDVSNAVSDSNRQLVQTLRDLGVPADHEMDHQAIDALIDERHVSDSLRKRVNELVSNHAVALESERQSGEELKVLRKRLTEIEDELDRTPGVIDPQTLLTVLEETGRPSDLLQTLATMQESCDTSQRRCEKLSRSLGTGHLPLEQVVYLKVPTQSVIESWEKTLDASTKRRDLLESQTDELLERQTAEQEKLDALLSGNALPADGELEQAREDRDRIVDQLSTELCEAKRLGETKSELRQSIRGADHVADQIRTHQTQVLQRSSAEQEIRRLQRELKVASKKRSEQQQELVDLEAEWACLWQPCEITPESPRKMLDWRNRHQTLMEQHEDLCRDREHLQRQESRIESAKSRLTSVIQLVSSNRAVTATTFGDVNESHETMSLETAYDVASVLRDELQQHAIRVRDLQKSRDALQRDLPRCETDHEQATSHLQQWERQWSESVERFADVEQESPKTIDARMRKVEQLFHARRERDKLIASRIKAESDIENFESTALSVAKAVGLELPPSQSGTEIAGKLFQLLREAIDADTLRKQHITSLQSVQEKLASDREDEQQASAELAMLCAEAEIEDIDDLPALEDKAAFKASMKSEMEKAEAQLNLLADDESVEAFAQRIESLESSDLTHQIDRQQHLVDELKSRHSELQQQIGAQQETLRTIDGGDKAAELNQEIQLLCGRIHHLSRHWAQRRVSSVILRQAIDHYRKENESPVLKIACEIFRDLTCQRYSGLQTDFDERDRQTLYGIKPSPDGSESLVSVDAMSLGTADALYLALRLASLEHQLSAGHSIPVIIDDCLIQLDDERTIAALRRLSRLSNQTQVILFTHHQHVVELASEHLKASEFHLHRLPA